MQEVKKTIILHYDDLNRSAQFKSIHDISAEDIKDSPIPIYKSEIVLFIDDKCQTKILKNRYGDFGNEMYKNMIEHSLSTMEKLTERYIEAEKFIMNLNWFEKLFCSKKIIKFLKSRSKYNF